MSQETDGPPLKAVIIKESIAEFNQAFPVSNQKIQKRFNRPEWLRNMPRRENWAIKNMSPQCNDFTDFNA